MSWLNRKFKYFPADSHYNSQAFRERLAKYAEQRQQQPKRRK